MSGGRGNEESVAGPGAKSFYARSVHAVARDLVGCTVRLGDAAGRIVEVESYHEEEPACHAHIGLTPRTRVLFGPPGHVYVYRSYGIHDLLNLVTEREGVGAAVLIRALEPLDGVERMYERRGTRPAHELCSGPGRLTQALGIGLELNGTPVCGGPLDVLPPPAEARRPATVSGRRIGITKATELSWRLCDATSDCVSRPWPPSMRAVRARERGGFGRRAA